MAFLPPSRLLFFFIFISFYTFRHPNILFYTSIPQGIDIDVSQCDHHLVNDLSYSSLSHITSQVKMYADVDQLIVNVFGVIENHLYSFSYF